MTWSIKFWNWICPTIFGSCSCSILCFIRYSTYFHETCYTALVTHVPKPKANNRKSLLDKEDVGKQSTMNTKVLFLTTQCDMIVNVNPSLIILPWVCPFNLWSSFICAGNRREQRSNRMGVFMEAQYNHQFSGGLHEVN